ncbi:hypothetical protein SAMN05428966_10241 [Massilia sp. PDC64]|nr:hypothetical protein [Massilia sp. PDC64]SDC64890.1 hypothetical protein SAMN05428966_10241 [Massilia sp. PDC64]
MNERGILFSAPMVHALLAGTKTQTRRAVKGREGSVLTDSRSPYGRPGDRLWVRESFFAWGRWGRHFNEKKQRDEWRFADMTRECSHAYQYAADDPDLPVEKGRSATPGWYARPALFMPRVASRILLEVVSVRVERLQTISEHDAVAEGIERSGGNPVDSYRSLWEQINGTGSWDDNPWIWVVEFRRVEA